MSRTRSPCEMFSPSSGSLNSAAPTGAARRSTIGRFAGAACGLASFCGTEAADGTASGLAAFGAAASTGLAFAARAIFEGEDHLPDFDLLAFFDPNLLHWCRVTDDGTSTTALSVSSSITGWPSVMLAPGEIIRRTRSPCEMFSPSSGNLNSCHCNFSSLKFNCGRADSV